MQPRAVPETPSEQQPKKGAEYGVVWYIQESVLTHVIPDCQLPLVYPHMFWLTSGAGLSLSASERGKRARGVVVIRRSVLVLLLVRVVYDWSCPRAIPASPIRTNGRTIMDAVRLLPE